MIVSLFDEDIEADFSSDFLPGEKNSPIATVAPQYLII
jgi:hypothetical protein